MFSILSLTVVFVLRESNGLTYPDQPSYANYYYDPTTEEIAILNDPNGLNVNADLDDDTSDEDFNNFLKFDAEKILLDEINWLQNDNDELLTWKKS